MLRWRKKIDRGEVYYLACNFVKFPYSRVKLMEDINILNYFSSGVCVHCLSSRVWSSLG